MRDLFLSYEDVAVLAPVPASLFRELLETFRPALDRAGLDPDELPEPGALWRHRLQLPTDLVDAIHRIRGLADEAGVEWITTAAGGPLFAGELDRIPVVSVVRTRLEHPALFERAVGRQFTEPVLRFREFVGRDRTPPRDDPDLAAAAGRIGAAFGRRARGESCRIRPWSERDGNRYFCIEHPGIPRIDRGIVDGEVRSVAFVPLERDLVVYDTRLGRLRVSAADAAVSDLYLRVFGELLFGDEGWFESSVVVTLDPLRRHCNRVLKPTARVLEARVVRLEVVSRTTGSGVVVARAADVLWMLSEQLVESDQHGPVRAATFRLRLLGETHLRDVIVEVPDVIAWDWRRGNAAIRNFLEEHGFVSGADGGASWLVA